MQPPDNSTSQFQLTTKSKKNNYHHLDKDNLNSERHDKGSSQQIIVPQISFYVHIKYSSEEILRKFTQYAQRKGYKVMRTFDNELLLVDSRFSVRIKKMFSCFSASSGQNRIRFWVGTDEYKSARVLQIASLRQAVSEAVLRGMIAQFSQRQLPNPEIRQDLDDEPQDLYSLEATSKYMYSKMLLEEGYSMGQKTRQFLDKVGRYSLSKIVDKSIVRWIEEMKNQMVHDLLKGFNCSRKQLTQILPFCRTTLEQFLYIRIYTDDGEIYDTQFQTTFPNTVKEIGKLDYIVAPYQLQRQFFWITVAYDHEYSAQNQKKVTLEELFRMVKPRNIDGKVELIKAYQEVLGENYVWRSTETVIKAVQNE